MILRLIRFFPLLVLPAFFALPLCADGRDEEADAVSVINGVWSSLGVGVGAAAISLPHYPGANQRDEILTPIPYLEYYGEKLRLDADGLAANIFQSERLNLDVSLNGSLPVSDGDNRARNGMDDLELVLEFGPELEITLIDWSDAALRFDIPIRAAYEVTLDDLPRDVGITFDPRLHYERNYPGWEWDIDVGAFFATERYHSLYYTVENEFVTAERSAYSAASGLTGWRVSSGMQKRWSNWIFISYLRYLNFSDAKNKQSPLMLEEDYWAGGVALVWMFKTGANLKN